MSWKIEIHRAKPNPTGKDKAGNQPLAKQLLGEWVDLKNVGDSEVALSTLHLANAEYDAVCKIKTVASIFWNGKAETTLKPQQIVRVHTGRSADSASMNTEDQSGVHYHAYAEKGSFVLNNTCGDILSVWWKSSDKWYKDDEASYKVNPTEGKVLLRVGGALV